MARVQVYVPDELHEQLKAHGLKSSELFQAAVRAELHRMHIARETETYIAERIAEFGEPSAEDWAYAQAIVDQIPSGHAQSAQAS